jgi:hypothetical protein
MYRENMASAPSRIMEKRQPRSCQQKNSSTNSLVAIRESAKKTSRSFLQLT